MLRSVTKNDLANKVFTKKILGLGKEVRRLVFLVLFQKVSKGVWKLIALWAAVQQVKSQRLGAAG